MSVCRGCAGSCYILWISQMTSNARLMIDNSRQSASKFLSKYPRKLRVNSAAKPKEHINKRPETDDQQSWKLSEFSHEKRKR